MTLLACRINGIDSDLIDVRDRACQYGDGLFETIAVRDGEPEFLNAHLQRLMLGAKSLAMPFPSSEEWQADIDSLVSGTERGVLKLILSRGQGGRGYAAPDNPDVSRLVMLYPWPDFPPESSSRGVNVRLCQTRLAIQPALAGLKHLNRLEQILARNEWQDKTIAEGLMQDTQGNVVEGTMSNLFLVKDDRLHTPDLSACGVDGIMRQQIIKLSQQLEIPLATGHYRREAVEAADGLFLTNSVIGIWPVRELDGQPLAIPALTEELMYKLEALRRNPNA